MFSQNQLLFLLNCTNMRTSSQYYTLHKHVNFVSVCISILYIIGTQMASYFSTKFYLKLTLIC